MDDSNIPDFLNNYLGYLAGIKNIASTTIEMIKSTISQFLEYINIYKLDNEYTNIKDMDLNSIRGLVNSDIYSYMFYLAENKYKKNSRITKVHYLKGFFKYLFTKKHDIFKEPFQEIRFEKKINKKLPNYLSLNEAQRFLTVFSNDKTKYGIRNYAMMSMFLNCGLRISELTNLKVNDINLKKNTISIVGKGNKERTGYLNKSAISTLKKYLEIRNEFIIGKDNGILFLSSKGNKIDKTCVRDIVKKGYKQAKIDNPHYSVHTLRHTCATLLYKTGADIKLIQELLGHSQVQTTDIYTHLYNEKIKRIMLNNPLAEFKMQDALEYCA